MKKVIIVLIIAFAFLLPKNVICMEESEQPLTQGVWAIKCPDHDNGCPMLFAGGQESALHKHLNECHPRNLRENPYLSERARAYAAFATFELNKKLYPIVSQ